MSISHERSCEGHGLHNEPLFSKYHAFLDLNPEQTSVGYLPIIQAPAHELDKLNTVVMRVLHVAESLQQEHAYLSNSR